MLCIHLQFCPQFLLYCAEPCDQTSNIFIARSLYSAGSCNNFKPTNVCSTSSTTTCSIVSHLVYGQSIRCIIQYSTSIHKGVATSQEPFPIKFLNTPNMMCDLMDVRWTFDTTNPAKPVVIERGIWNVSQAS
jgi:hypothetical protein